VRLRQDLYGIRVRLLSLALILWAASAAQAQPKKAKPAEGADEAVPAAEADDPVPEAPAEEETEDLIKIDKMELPSFSRLMQGPPIDWIVLTNFKVLEVEPLYPRPGTIDDLKERIKQMMRKGGKSADPDFDRRKRLAMYNLPVTLLEGEEREYKLHIRYIREIIYYEDLMLRRIDKLLDEKQVRQAYELLVALDQRQETWPGVGSRRERLQFVEAQVQFESQRFEQALALLEALYERNATYPGLDEQMGTVFDRLIETAHANDDPRQARFFLKRLARRIPGHKLALAWTNRIMQHSRDLLARGVAAESAGQLEAALDLTEQAIRMWPELPELLPVYNRLANRWQRLFVGVVSFPVAADDDQGERPVVVSFAERRYRQLTETPLFQPARVSDKIARYQTRFFQDWDPADLGHSVVFRLKTFHAAGLSQPMLTAAGLADALSDRLNPSSGDFDARLAAAIAGLSVRGPFELAVQFRQVPLRPEALFAFPYRRPAIASAIAATAAGEGSAGASATFAATYPFERRESGKPDRALYRRTVPEPERRTDRHVAEVIETRYESHEKAIQGLLRGEVSLLPHVPVSTIKSFSGRNEFFTLPYGLPTTHLLQFHPNSRVLQSRALRRGLIYALDRRRILEEVFLSEPAGGLGRQISAPWPTGSYAYSRFILPHPFDQTLAFSLARTAEKELGEKLPPLRLWIPDDPEVRQSAARIVESWNRIGVQTTLIPADSGTPAPSLHSPDWDVAYRTEMVAEPLVELWPLLALTPSTETATLSYLPTWLRHDLLALDRIGDWRSAEDLLHKLHRQLWAEVHLIPLWEIDSHFVVRKNVRNIPERPLFPYQGIEHWKVEPWYSRD
jgi:tetratricopeptide (TPR) repeat protein